MSEEKTERQELIDEWASLQSTGAIDGEDAAHLSRCMGCPVSPMPEALKENEGAICALAQDVALEQPPSDLKGKVIGAVEDREKSAVKTREMLVPQGFTYLLDGEGDWKPLPFKGAKFKKLSGFGKAPFISMLIELEPGTRLAGHSHKGAEQTYVISGDLECDGVRFGAGDCINIDDQCEHGEFHSPSGCLAFVVTSSGNFPEGALAVYGAFSKTREKMRRLIGR